MAGPAGERSPSPPVALSPARTGTAAAAGTMSVTAGRPSVMVPVLSSTIVRSLCAVSSEAPSRMSTPFWAPLPVPTMTAVGVARPRAQGQAMTSTAMALMRA